MHLMNFKELTGQQLTELVNLGLEVKQNPKKFTKALEGKSLALIFQKTSTRTRVSFEVVMECSLIGELRILRWLT